MALVITIAIIIILATITINMAFGDNGLVEKAELAKNMVEESSKKEQEELSNAAIWLNEVIFGEGGNTGTNEQVPESNNTDINGVVTNSVDTNTIEPPPVEIPDGNEEGAIIFGTPTWKDGKANVTIGTETEYKIEYQINKTDEGSWKELSLSDEAEGTKQGTVGEINHNDTIYARLTDGTNYGEYASITIKDSTAPTKANIEISKENLIKGSPIEALVNHTDKETGVDIGKSKWILTNSPEELGTDEGSYTGGTFSSNGETISIPTTEAGEYYIHVLTVDKAENKVETVSNKITVNEITGSIEITGPTWKENGTAEIEITTDNPDVTIKYQVNDGEWKEYEGPIIGLENGDKVDIKLTNGDEEGEEKTIEIKDTKAPEVKVSIEDKSASEITVKVEATDEESGIGGSEAYTYYIKKTGEPDNSYQKVGSSNNSTYAFTELEQGTSYDIKVEVTDKVGNTGSGEIKEQTTDIIPGGEDSIAKGTIAFGTVSWANEEASITISTNTEYTIQYQVNGTEEDGWKNINSGEKVTELKHNNEVYARLTDGTNYGEPASKVVADGVAPAKATISLNKTEAIAGQTITATVTHTDKESGVDIAKSKWVFNTSSTNIGTDEASYTGTFSSNGQTISIPTKDVGTYYLHVLTVDKAGNKTETISEAVVLNKIEGDIEIGAPTWKAGTASVTLSTTVGGYTIQYKINSGSWLNLADLGGENTGTNGTVSGLNHNDVLHARLTNGAQYGDEIQTTIKDSTAPKVTVQVTTKNTNSITVNANATDNESGMASTVTYTYYIKKTSESDYVQKASNTTNTYTFSGLTQGTSYDIKVEVTGDKAGNKGSSTVTGQITESLPGGDEGLEQGAISFGSITWAGGTASVPVSTNTSLTLEYQVATSIPTDGKWKTITNNESVTGINHNETVYARLTDGVNYGEYASMTIKDTKAPTLEIVQGEITYNSIAITVNAVDNETGLAETETYKYYLNEESEAREITTNSTYTFTKLTSETQYNIKVEVIDKAGNVGTGTTSISTEEQKIEDMIGGEIVTDTTIVEDDLGNKVTIPAGFKIAEDSGHTVQQGIVIEDVSASTDVNVQGSQYVWIPVGTFKKDDGSTSKNIQLARYTFSTSSPGTPTAKQYATNYTASTVIYSYYTESVAYDEGLSEGTVFDRNATAKDLKGFIDSVNENGGYYIGRYEASYASGSSTSDYKAASKISNSCIYSYPSDMVFTKGNLWMLIKQPEASKVAINTYAESTSVKSDLINSYAWDTAIVYIQEAGNTNYANQTTKNTNLANTGENNDEVCKINDMASNLSEWTTEHSSYTRSGGNIYPCVYRAGNYANGYTYYEASNREYYRSSGSGSMIGFRLCLYI